MNLAFRKHIVLYFGGPVRYPADPSDRAVQGVGVRPIACWDCGFESRRGRGCLSFVGVLSRQVEVSVSS